MRSWFRGNNGGEKCRDIELKSVQLTGRGRLPIGTCHKCTSSDGLTPGGVTCLSMTI